jgi:hypothetical protein
MLLLEVEAFLAMLNTDERLYVSFKEGFFEDFRGFAGSFSIPKVFSSTRAAGQLFFMALPFPKVVSTSEVGASSHFFGTRASNSD